MIDLSKAEKNKIKNLWSGLMTSSDREVDMPFKQLTLLMLLRWMEGVV